ncbi:LPD29 domain-containing protein [Pseudobutyrivibrio sp.]|uniref:LPD29 domain-containing protein n=1 Tax=Pseudobutyrivibrio sp. TaxID=2014367 RepID=UPI0025CC4B4E|nr:LPD29 domain-containing protein [Pseudobutyrivibrio sp.]
MSKFFKNIQSLEQLKNNYRDLLKANHPDNGGDLETMQDINCEYDALFTIWKNKEASTLTEEQKKETAASSRKHFYTQFGWAGSRYDGNLTLKEIAKIVRNYVKEQYPTCKFSVRTKYASMCQELIVDLKEFPSQMFKTGEDLKNEGIDYNCDSVRQCMRRMEANDLWSLTCWDDDDFVKAYDKALEVNAEFYGIMTDYFKSVVDDVNTFVNSYNYDDSDSMTDYFDVNFYFFGCGVNGCKYVPKTARIKNHENNVTPSEPSENVEDVNYTIEKSEHTKTGETIYLVKPVERMDHDTFNSERQRMKENGGYYSKFTHSFVFKEYPSFLDAEPEQIESVEPETCEAAESTAEGAQDETEVLEISEPVAEPEKETAEHTAEPEQGQQENVLDSFFRRYGSPSEFAEHTLHLYAHRASGLHTEADILREIKRADDFMKDLQHYMECLKAHQAELVKQYNFIATSPTKNKIRLERKKNSWTNKVMYSIIYFTVNLNDFSETESGRESFEGKERKKALDRFAELEASHPDYILEKDIEKARWER